MPNSTTNLFALLICAFAWAEGRADLPWKEHRGKPGPSGWRCHVVQPDPKNDGPDGINLHDWDCDGDLDIFANAEEGMYSRLYFNPGPEKIRDRWSDYIEFQHDQCEDSGIGDLDDDGDIDYVANGGRVYFNPGVANVRKRDAWTSMVLFKTERRIPTVYDLDGDGLNDLIVGAQEWYKQPDLNKHDPANWKKFIIGKNRWPMNCIMNDIDQDGDMDMIVPDRGREICWYENPGMEEVTQPWQRKTLHSHSEPMFMAVGDVNGDQRDDFVITGGSKGKLAEKLIILLRTNDGGEPDFDEVILDQPSGLFPKGVAIAELDGDSSHCEILVIPKSGDMWIARRSVAGLARKVGDWTTTTIRIPGAETRKKMDNAWLGDLDGDGDLDVVTTEENGGWGVIWFDNPTLNPMSK